jgi:hypothetical protein
MRRCPAHPEPLIFGPIVFPLFALVHLGLSLLALSKLSVVPFAAVGLFVVEFVTFFDNAVVASGNRIGVSAHLEKLNRARFFLHAVFIAGLVPAYAGIGELAGMQFFATAFSEYAVAVLTASVMLFGYFVGWRKVNLLMPVNYYGCLRYAQSVNAASRLPDHTYSEAELEQTAFPPVTSIITVVIGLVLSIWIGVATGFWIPAVVTGLMLLAGNLPANGFGALATSALEIIYSGGMVYSLVSLAAN